MVAGTIVDNRRAEERLAAEEEALEDLEDRLGETTGEHARGSNMIPRNLGESELRERLDRQERRERRAASRLSSAGGAVPGGRARSGLSSTEAEGRRPGRGQGPNEGAILEEVQGGGLILNGTIPWIGPSHPSVPVKPRSKPGPDIGSSTSTATPDTTG